MPTAAAEFADDTAFERYLLDRTTPLLPRSPAGSVIDCGDYPNSISVAARPQAVRVEVTMTDSSGSGQDDLSLDDIGPLLFGAAWKVLDLLVELMLEQAGVSHDQRSRYSINFKAREAEGGASSAVSPFASRLDLWSRVLKIYAGTRDLRHSLVHRRLKVDPATGDMHGEPSPSGPAPTPLTAREQMAFCQVAVAVAEAVIHDELQTRQANQLSWALDQLAAHHGEGSLGASPASGVVPVVIVRPQIGPSNELTLNMTAIAECAQAAVQDVSYYDLKIYLPDQRVLAGHLEDAPTGSVTFPVDHPPPWLHWE